jgi:FecR protein
MTPPISKDWWAAAAAVAGTIPAAMGQVPPAPPPTGRQQAGIVTSVAPQAPSGIQVAPLFLDSASNQRLVNNTAGPMHVLFSDQSALTLAPGTEVMIAQYRFQPEQNTGNLAVNLLKGLLRVVGGKISKTNAAQVRTATATVGIRGGISIVEYKDDGQTNAKFLFGQDLTFTLDGGNRNTGGSGGSSDAGSTDEEFRKAGWFTDGGDVGLSGSSGGLADSGDNGDSGQSDPGLVAQIRAVLTKPGWEASAGGAALLAKIDTGTFTAASLQASLEALQFIDQKIQGGQTTVQSALALGTISNASSFLVPAPAPPPPAGSPTPAAPAPAPTINSLNPSTSRS